MEILDIIDNRFSPYEFSSQELTQENLDVLFTAAGKAASAFNEQPWRFIYALRQDEDAFGLLHNCLVEGNKDWTSNVAALVFTVISTSYAKNGKPNNVAKHDLGLAVGNLTVQASHMGIYLHQMAGILHDKVISDLGVPEGFEPVTAIALGYYDKEPNMKPRKSIKEIAFKGKWS